MSEELVEVPAPHTPPPIGTEDIPIKVVTSTEKPRVLMVETENIKEFQGPYDTKIKVGI